VGLVVVFHAFPAALPGGYVGVDVFFVISGFLITGLLLREITDTGRISLPQFYARRVRRILPAAVIVTLATLVATGLIVGPIRFARTLTDAAWATVSLANYHFSTGDGYFTQGDPSPFLHFWSLSVEEQFYLLWPPVLLLLAIVPRARKLLPALLAMAILASLTASIVLTDEGSSSAYFSLLTRAWELGVGAALAWAVDRGLSPRGRIAAALPVAGILMIAAAAWLFNGSTSFPGFAAALPVAGAALMIWGASGPVAAALSVRPVTYVGDISYSLYLWHWPVLLLGSIVLGTSAAATAVLIAVSVALGALSYNVVERRLQRARRKTPAFAVVATGVSLALLISSCSAMTAVEVPTTGTKTFTAAPSVEPSIADANGAGPVPAFVPANVQPHLADLLNDLAPVFTNGCFQGQLAKCSSGTGATSIVLAGDSHAGMWSPAFTAVAAQNGWTVHVVGHNGCPIIPVPISQADGPQNWPDCDAWQVGAIAQVAAWHPALILLDDNTTGYMSKVSLREDFVGRWEPALDATLTRLRAIAPVLFMGQLPTFTTQPADCLSAHLDDVPACSIPVSAAVPDVVKNMNERAATAPGVTYLDPTKFLCTETCPLMSYNLVMYRDASHLDATYTRRLGPLITEYASRALSG